MDITHEYDGVRVCRDSLGNGQGEYYSQYRDNGVWVTADTIGPVVGDIPDWQLEAIVYSADVAKDHAHNLTVDQQAELVGLFKGVYR